MEGFWMLNVNDYDEEEVVCSVCGYVYVAAPDDPHDLCECPNCVEKDQTGERTQDDLIDRILLEYSL